MDKNRLGKRISRAMLLLIFAGLPVFGKVPVSGVDSVYFNANIHTMNSAAPTAEAVAIDNGKIVYVGSNDGALALADKDTARYDVKGQMVLPGFIDTHTHPIAGGAFAKALALDTFGKVDGWVNAIAAYAKDHPDAPMIFGYGFLSSAFGPDGPTRQLLDAAVPDRPVLIMDEGFHGAWANSKALEKLNITQDTPDPVPGLSYYKRDANGDATGYLLEGTADMAMDSLNVVTEDSLVDGTAYVFDVMNSYGVTSLFDASEVGYEEMLPRVLQRLERSGALTMRIVGSSRPHGPEDVDTAVATAMHWRDTLNGKRYHYRELKIIDDGTVEGRTAAMFEDYQGEPGNSGKTVFTQDEMNRMVVGAAKNNLDVHIHAIGDRTVNEALNAVEAARNAYPGSETRYTICHIEVITDQDLPRFASLNVIAQSTPLWASYDTFGKQFVSDDQFNRYWRYNSLHKLGVRLTFGSDFPASGAGLLGLSPIVQIEVGHTRQEPGNPDAPVQPRKSERLDIETLLRGYTIDAAYQLHMENEIGSIEVGKFADLIVLDHNLFDIDPYKIHETKVIRTVLGGEIVYSQQAAK